MTLVECITAGKDIIIAISASSVAILAYMGLSTWSKELKGKAEYHLAKEVLKSVYEVREAFKLVRNPVIFQFEYPEDMINHQGHLMEEHRYKGTAHVYEERWKKMDSAFKELENYHLKAQVEWGPEFQNVIKDLRSCRADLLIAIQRMLERLKSPDNRDILSIDEKNEEKSVLYYIGNKSEHDKFTTNIEKAIEKFEKWLRPHVKKN